LRHRIAAVFHALARLAFGATIVLIPFRWRIIIAARPFPPVFRDYSDFLFFASDWFVLATLALWTLTYFFEPRRLRFTPLFLTIPIAGLTVIGTASAVSSFDPALSIYHSTRLLALFGLYLFVLNEIGSLRDIYLPMGCAVFVQSAVGIGQVFQQRSLGLLSIGELLLNPEWKGISTVWTGTTLSLRAYGLTDHPNILGGCLAVALLSIAVWYASTHSAWRALIASLVALGALALLLTFSRSAWLALGTGALLGVFLFLATRQTRLVIDWVALGFASAIVVAPFAWQDAGFLAVRLDPNAPSLFNGQARAVVERAALNAATLEIFAQHPLLGAGLGTTPLVIRATHPDFAFDYQPAHLVLLDVAAETGVIGALFYLAAMTAPWIALWRNRSRVTFSPALIGVSGVLLAVTVIGFFDYYTWLLIPGRLLQWLSWGLWGATFSGASNV